MNHIFYKGIRKICRRKGTNIYTNKRVQYSGQMANDFIAEAIKNNKNGLMISKFGTIELNSVCCYLANQKLTSKNIVESLRGEYTIYPDEAMKQLCYNAGFFPQKLEMWEKYNQKVLEDIPQIDILASYQYAEDKVQKYFKNCTNVDLDGFYAPFLWDRPWTKQLEGKKVLVIHPFIESIKKQYKIREKLFENKDVLPEFEELKLIKAVQSMAQNEKNLEFKDWFEALFSMEKKMDEIDYDIALIGCGAYGMNLAAHAKSRGKIAIHLAGWTQMLFGIYGNRWIVDQPQYSKYINKHWIRPGDSEKPIGADKIEGGCYW